MFHGACYLQSEISEMDGMDMLEAIGSIIKGEIVKLSSSIKEVQCKQVTEWKDGAESW